MYSFSLTLVSRIIRLIRTSLMKDQHDFYINSKSRNEKFIFAQKIRLQNGTYILDVVFFPFLFNFESKGTFFI